MYSNSLFCFRLQIAELLRGSKLASLPSSMFGEGSALGLSLDAWRVRIRQVWMSGLLEREMKLGKGHNLLGQMVCNTFLLSEAGQAFRENPHPFNLPDTGIRRAGVRPSTERSQHEPITTSADQSSLHPFREKGQRKSEQRQSTGTKGICNYCPLHPRGRNSRECHDTLQCPCW